MSVSISKINGSLRVSGAGAVKALLKVPGRRFDKNVPGWVYPATPTSASETYFTLENETGEEVEVDDYVDKLLVSQQIRNRALNGFGDLSDVPGCKTKPFHHQTVGTRILEAVNAQYFGWEMGTGKSKAIVDAVFHLKLRNVLIVCPKSVVLSWGRQFDIHGWFPCDLVSLLKGTTTKRSEILKSRMGAPYRGHPRIAVVNYEAAWRARLGGAILDTEWDMVVLDEAHRIKDPSPKAKASNFFAKLGAKSSVGRKVCLSGTPMPKGPLDLFAQLRFLDPGVFGTKFVSFRDRYAVVVKQTKQLPNGRTHQYPQIVNLKNLDELKTRWRSIAHVVRKDDVLDLPERTDVDVDIELAPKTWKIYQELEETFLAQLPDDLGTVDVSNVLVELIRFQQVTGGFIKNDVEEIIDLGTEKADALADILDGLLPDEPVVVFCNFHHDLDAVAQAAQDSGRLYAELSGRTNDFDLDKDGRYVPNYEHKGATVWGVQIQSGGLGIDFTHSAYSVYFSTGFNRGNYLQSRDRTHRPGQERPVTYYHLLATGTVDEKIRRTFKRDGDVVEAILDRQDSDVREILKEMKGAK